MFLETAEPLAKESTLKKGLDGIREILATSAIARHGKSPIENSLVSLKQSTVSFNEKTMRWHDSQTKLMVKGSDPRVEAAKLKPEPSALKTSAEMVTDKKVGLGVLAGFLKDIVANTKQIADQGTRTIEMFAPDSAEDESEDAIKAKKAAKEEKGQSTSLKGIWASMKERAKKNWFVENWKIIAASLFILFAPLKWIKNIWEWVKSAFEFSKDHPLIAAMLALGAVIIGPLNLLLLGFKAIKGVLVGGFKLLKVLPGFVKKLPGHLGTAVGKMKKWGKVGVEGVKKFGATMKKGVTTIASPVIKGAKFVGGKAMEAGKFVGGKAMEVGKKIGSTGGDWFKKLMGKFGTAGKFLVKMGKSVIQGLMTMGPYGWGIIGGIALGGLVWFFWDDVVKVWDKVAGSIKEGFTAILTMASGIVGSAKSMLGNFLRSVGAGMIADWIDPDGADKSKPAKEFTWGGFAKELWNIYTGIWKKIFEAVKKVGKIVGKGAVYLLKAIPFVPDWFTKLLGGGKDEKDTGVYAEGPTPQDIKDKKAADEKARGGMKWKDFKMAEEKKFAASGGNAADWVSSVGGHKAAKALYKSSLSGGTVSGQGTTADEPGVSTPPVSTPPVSTSHPVQPSSIPHKTITTTPSGEDIHKAVKVSKADMSGVSWSKLGGRDTIEGIILNTWNQAGVSAAPTFTSGFRKKDNKLSLKNPNSKHIQKTAFDLRSKDLGSKAGGIFASLMSAFQPLGLWGQHEKGKVNAKNRSGEHFHFQLASKGFEGIVGKDGPRGFIAGESGEELVRIQPLVSPDAKMNAMNALNAENQTVRGQSGSPTIINTTNAQATTTNQTGGVFTLPNLVSAPKLTTSLPSLPS